MKNLILLTALFFSATVLAETIKIGASSSLSTAGIYIAQERGYFKKEGLQTEIIVLNNSTAQMTTLLAKNELHVGAGNLIAGLFNAYAAGEKFKIVADKGHVSDKNQYIWLAVRKDLFDSKKVSSVADLKGLKIGLPSIEGSSQQIALESILKSGNLTNKDVKLVKVGYSEMKMAFQQKEIDAAVQLEPFLQDMVESEIGIKFKSVNEFRPNQQSAILIYSEKFAADKKNAQKFMKAYLKGVKDYNKALANKEEWLKLAPVINKYAKLDGEKSWGKMEPVGLKDNGSMNIDSIKADFEWYKANGFIKGEVTPDQVVDTSFLPKK